MIRSFVGAMMGIAFIGCTQSPPEYLDPPAAAPVVASPQVMADSEGEGPGALPDGAVRIDPLPNCEPGQVTTLHWTDEAVAQGPIRFWIEGDPPALFAESGSVGSKQTGAWAHPGQRFRVTDASGRTLARLVVESEIACD
ncbi:MAG: hypothetical protein ACK4XJ_12330 [Fimbriimonadaceae bacterium]